MRVHNTGLQAGAVFAVAIVTTAIVASAGQANAADAPIDWTGPHVGVTVGYSVGNAKSQAEATGTGGIGGYWASGDDSIVGRSARHTPDPYGLNAGFEAGYKYQMGSFVPGIDVGFGAFKLEDSATNRRTYLDSNANHRVNSKVETDWLATLRPKLGYAFDRFLLDGGFGLAVTRVTLSQSFTDSNAFTMRSSTHDTQFGWTAGASLSYALTANWSIKGEYMYTDFGNVDTTGRLVNNAGTANRSQIRQSIDLEVHTVRAGITYKF